VTEQLPASRTYFSRREGIVARQKIRRVATNKVKLRPTVFFAGDCALETRIIYGALRGVPAEGVGEDYRLRRGGSLPHPSKNPPQGRIRKLQRGWALKGATQHTRSVTTA